MAAKKKSKKNTDSKIFIILFAGVLILGVYFMFTGNDPLGLFEGIEDVEMPSVTVSLTQGAEDAANAPESAPAVEEAPEMGGGSESVSQAGWWEVYFADYVHHNDPANYAGSIEAVLIEKIDAAQSSIHIASFEFNLTPVAEALIRAHERGVDVRWVTDDEHGIEADEEPGHGQFAMLEDAGIELVDDQRGALMHNKFWIFDREILWTGSTNITENGIFAQDNNVIVIHSPELAEIYEREFDEMWNGEFGPRSTSTVDDQQVLVEGTEISVLFASEDDVMTHIVPYIADAQKSVRVLAFSFTHDGMGAAITERFENGVDVWAVFEKTGSSTEYSELGGMYCAGMNVRRDENPSFLHHKIVIIDDHIVMTGSLNFSDNANESNDENVLIVDNAAIASLYIQEFERIWAMSSEVEDGKFDCAAQ